MQYLIDKSNHIAYEITNDIKKLLNCIDDETLGYNFNISDFICNNLFFNIYIYILEDETRKDRSSLS